MEDGKKSIVNNVSADKVNSEESSPESEAVQTSEESSKHLSKKTESLESALRKFKKQSSGIISEIRKREAYDKPSVKRKKKSKEARRHKKMGRYGGSGRW